MRKQSKTYVSAQGGLVCTGRDVYPAGLSAWGGCLPGGWGVCPGGVSYWGYLPGVVCPEGVCLPTRVMTRGVCTGDLCLPMGCV